MNLSALPRWARWAALAVVGLGLVSVAAIPFVDATRALPPAVARGASYTYVVEPATTALGNLGRVEVTVSDGTVVGVDVLSCLSGVDCLVAVEPYVPYEAMVAEVAGRHWTILTGEPLLDATYDDPGTAGEERSVRVLDYRER